MRILFAFALFLALALPGLPARAGNFALVIGNAAYRNLPALPTTQADAGAVAAALGASGFEVTALSDLDRDGFRAALRAFRDKADTADVVAVYFAGYGVRAGGKSYLVPVDGALEDARDAEWDLIALEDVLRQIAGAAALRTVFLDAARPLPGGRAAEAGYAAGLAPVSTAPPATMVGYATAPGVVRPDPAGAEHAPYSAALADALSRPIANPLTLMQEVQAATRARVPGADPYLFSNFGTDPAEEPAAAPRPPLPEAEAKRELQRMLKARKCYYGAIDGIWGGGSVRGMNTFVSQAGIEFPVSRNMDAGQLNAAITVLDAHPEVTCPPRKRSSTRRSRSKRKVDKPRFCPDYGMHEGCPNNY